MSVLFLDIDTQIDFMMPQGALYVPQAEQLLPVLKRISDYAIAKHIPVLASADAHAVDDPEFEQFPPHCIKGRPGQQKVAETYPKLFLVEEHDEKAVNPENLNRDHVLFEKRTFDVFSNPKIELYLQHYQPEQVVVYGVATDYCVQAAVLSLLERDYPVVLLTDAIKAVDPSLEAGVLKNLQSKGALLTTFDIFSK